MISVEMRQTAVESIKQAHGAVTIESSALQVASISRRTLERQRESPRRHGDMGDRRQEEAAQSTYPQTLTEQEKPAALDISNSPEFHRLAASPIVPILADRGQQLASESNFYLVLSDAGWACRSGCAAASHNVAKPKAFQATALN